MSRQICFGYVVLAVGFDKCARWVGIDNCDVLRIMQLQQVQTGDEMKALLDGDQFDLRCTCGITLPSSSLKFKDLSELIRNICLHFVIYASKSELDQIRDGLKTLSLLSVMESRPLHFLPLFLGGCQQELTADKLIGHFKIQQWSPKGSNDREDEEAIVVNWENYIRETAGQYKC